MPGLLGCISDKIRHVKFTCLYDAVGFKNIREYASNPVNYRGLSSGDVKD